MVKFLKSDRAVIVAILVISLAYWLDLPGVPFHPDESTQIFMAADLKTAFTHPRDLFWRPENSNDRRLIYREIDPPLTRYLIGLGLAVSRQTPLPEDWEWSWSLEQNQANGALPSRQQLLASRLAVAALFPLSLIFAYWIGKKLYSNALGWFNLILLSLNALVLLHTRRAMAESALLTGVLFTLWASLTWKRRRFWLALPAALAFNAKYSALPLALVGLAAIFWDHPSERITMRTRLIQAAVYTALFAAITFILNPFLWGSPLPALRDALAERQALIQAQSRDLGNESEAQVLSTLGEKSDAVLAQLFFGPPAVQDVRNYESALAEIYESYLANPLHTLLTGWIGGAIALFLFFTGLALILFQVLRAKTIKREQFLIFASFLLQLAAILAVIRIPFQRYYLPLVPYVTLFIAYSLVGSIEFLAGRKPAKKG